MKKQGVSAADVAKLAGVSRTTVSFVLNNTPGKIIPEETRTRVLDAARELNYTPDEAAQRVAKASKMTVGFIISHSSSVYSDAYIIRLIEGMAPVFNKRRCELVLLPVKPGRSSYMNRVREIGLDGVLVTNTHENDPGISEICNAGIPMVVIGTVNEPKANQIDVENESAARIVAEYLIGLGHRRIGMIVHAPLSYYAAHARLAGFNAAMSEAGLPVDQTLVRIADLSEESGYRAMNELLDLRDPPKAVFAGNDAIAYGAIQAIYDRGLKIPQDISIAGFDDDFPSRYMYPPLTTMSLPAPILGERAATMILDLVEGTKIVEKRVLMPTSLAVRQSCAPAGNQIQ